MTREPDNVVLRLLRDMHESMVEVKDAIARVEKKQDDMNETMITALDLAAHANVRHESLENQVVELRKRVEKLEQTT